MTTLAFLAFPIHADILNRGPVKRELLISNVYAIIIFLTVSISHLDVQEDDVLDNIVYKHSDCPLMSLED